MIRTSDLTQPATEMEAIAMEQAINMVIKKTLEVENLFIYNQFLGAFGKVKNTSFMIDFLKEINLDYSRVEVAADARHRV